MLAAVRGHLDMVDLLLSVGAEVNSTRVSGYIPSHGNKCTMLQ